MKRFVIVMDHDNISGGIGPIYSIEAVLIECAYRKLHVFPGDRIGIFVFSESFQQPIMVEYTSSTPELHLQLEGLP